MSTLEGLAVALGAGRGGALLGEHLRCRRDALLADGLPGYLVAERLSSATDKALIRLHAASGAKVALAATGGYGRGRLAPYSDLDLLILTPPGEARAAEALLYPLFDTGLTIAQAVHDPVSAVRSAEEDLPRRTAFLDARLLAGDRALFEDYRARYDRLRRRTATAFVEAKLAERDGRHEAQGSSRYVIEPDVKEGKGGLRDLDVLHWLDRYTDGIDEDPVLDVVTPGLFTPDEAARLRRVHDFLWSVRVALHSLRGRADERLTFDVQPELARRLGYRGRPGRPAAERLMKHYFLNATEVGRLTGSACARLEQRALKPSALQRVGEAFGLRRREVGIDGEANLVRLGDRLGFVDEDRVSPRELMAYFLALGRHGLGLTPEAQAVCGRVAQRYGRTERADPDIARLFLGVLREPPDPPRLLRRMTECGLLPRYLPAFGRIVGKAEYGLYRRYTLDEHTLRACEVLGEARRGEREAEFPIVTPLARREDPSVLYLALLMQETGAGLARPTPQAIARRVRANAQRLLPKAQADDIAFLVEHRDLLARTAQRRAVAELSAVEEVARVAGSRQRLERLAIVTACRHRTAGHGSWAAYRDRDARLLVEGAFAYLTGGEAALIADRTARERSFRREAGALTALGPGAAARFFRTVEPAFWSMASPEAAARLAETAVEMAAGGASAAARIDQLDGGTVRLIVVAPDRVGLFASVVGVVAERGATVWGATAFSLLNEEGQTAHAVTIVEAMRPGTPPEPWDVTPADAAALRVRLLEAARGAGEPPGPPPAMIADRRAVFDVEPVVRAFTTGSEDCLIVEAEGLDRPGLLAKLAAALAATNVAVRRAFVATYGERAVDTFYLQDADGAKIEQAEVIAEVEAALMRVLKER